MIDVKQAVQEAQRFLQDLVPVAQQVAIEEIELSDDEAHWSVTLSYFEGASAFAQRKYKIFQVSTSTGQIKAMKIRSMK